MVQWVIGSGSWGHRVIMGKDCGIETEKAQWLSLSGKVDVVLGEALDHHAPELWEPGRKKEND